MNGELGQKAANVLTYILLAAIVVGGLAFMFPNYKRSNELKAHNLNLEKQIQQRKEQLSELRNNQNRFRTDSDFVELIARRNHRVLPGELLFIFEKK